MKKLFSIILALSLALSGITVFAEREATVNTEQNNIYISGQADASIVTILMKNKTDNTIAYADEIETKNGEYSFKFKFNEDYTDYNLYVMDGVENITDTIMETKAEAFYPVGEITQNKFSDDGTTADISAYVENKYNDEGSAKVIVSWLDENGTMVSCVTKDITYDYYSGADNWTLDVPEKAVKAKVFVWSSLANCVPLAATSKTLPNKNVVLIGDSLGQTYTDDVCTKGWGQYLGNYMYDGANIINCCHAGWETWDYLYYDDADADNFWLQGWNYSKQLLGEGDYVIFGLGYNDYTTKGYKGKYYGTVDGENMPYYSPVEKWGYERLTDDNGEYIEIDGEKVYTASNGSDLTTDSESGHLSFFYLDENGVKQSYAADSFYDNMKTMIEDCRDLGVNVIIRNVACISSPTRPQSRENKDYHGFVTHAIINEKAELLDEEYDNVITLDLFTESYNHFLELYNSFSDEAPEYAYEDGELKEYYQDVTNWKLQQLYDTYWLTIKNFDEYFSGGTIEKAPNGKWSYKTAEGVYTYIDSLHYASGGADYIASAIAKLIAQTDSELAEYVR